jgi:hypothetical protein
MSLARKSVALALVIACRGKRTSWRVLLLTSFSVNNDKFRRAFCFDCRRLWR